MLPDRSRMAMSMLEPADQSLLQGGSSPQPDRKLIDRMSMLPIGQYEDGSLTLAWPQMLVDIGNSFARSLVAQEGRPVFDDGGQYVSGATMEPLDGLNVASIPALGTFGAGAAGLTAERAAPTAARMFANDANASAPSIALNAMEKPQGIRAYHGSPHDFDKFSMEHIGKGEGNQSYGRGLYFAYSEDVAKGYRDGLSKGSPGHMYEVNINAEPEQFLDWDKPLSQQSEAVRTALLPLAQEEAARELKRRAWNNARSDANLREMLGKEPSPRPPLPTVDELAQRMWGNEFAAGNESRMRELGIPGIRYLDSVSRTAGDGSYNYSVFDDSLIDIMRKYANPEIAAAPSLLLNSEDGQQNPVLANEDVSTSDILRRYGLLTPDRPQDPPVNTIPRGAPDPFDRYNDPWGEVPMIINNPFADPPPPEPKRLPRPMPFWLGPPSG